MKNDHKDLPRSYLFVPGNRPDRFNKALASSVDKVIIDLEDAVPPEQKLQARKTVAEYLSSENSICLRINSTDTEWFNEDLAVCSLAGVDSIMLPKVETMEQINQVTSKVQEEIPILPFIESAQGYWNMREVAAAHRVQRLVFGTLDFILDLGMDAQGDELNTVRLQMVLVSRLANIAAPVEGVSMDIKDVDGLRNDTQRARRLGFGAKLCIHPSQVAEVNACFTYNNEEIEWARKVVAAAAESKGAVFSLEGKMIDRPVIERARVILQDKG